MDPEIKLKPGNIDHKYNDDPDYPIFIDERYTNSMAKAMEDAFKTIWPEIMRTDVPKINNHLRMMFVAIAQGVVEHMVKNAHAFKVNLATNPEHTHEIEDANYSNEHINEDYHRHDHPASDENEHSHEVTVEITEQGTLNLE